MYSLVIVKTCRYIKIDTVENFYISLCSSYQYMFFITFLFYLVNKIYAINLATVKISVKIYKL